MDTLTVRETTVAGLTQFPRAIEEIFRGDLTALIVRGFLAPELLAGSVRRVESGEVKMLRLDGPIFKGCLYGRPLAASRADLSDYLADSVPGRGALTELFGQGPSLEERVRAALTALAGGVPVELARSADGRDYMPTSIRVLIAGDQLPPHAENQTLNRPASRELKERVDGHCVMSFYLPVQLPEAGGLLTVVSGDQFKDGDGQLGKLGDKAKEALEATGTITIKPGVGDLLVFESGRRYHWVSPVEGPRARWTLGGFFAYTKAHDRILFWA